MYVLDTNAVIYFVNSDVKAVQILDNIFSKPIPIFLSTISEIELFGFSGLTNKDRGLIEELLATITIISVDSRIARIASDLRANYRLKTPDSAIAATALFTGSTLITRNAKDFKNIPTLKILKV